MTSLKFSTVLGLTILMMTAFGAGCSKKTDTIVAPRPQLEQLRKPPAAAVPSQEPVVPQEAAKIPRPY